MGKSRIEVNQLNVEYEHGYYVNIVTREPQDDGGECVVITSDMDPDKLVLYKEDWPLLKKAIDRMFREIAKSEKEKV